MEWKNTPVHLSGVKKKKKSFTKIILYDSGQFLFKKKKERKETYQNMNRGF